mmetsp:Transcript_33906/g.79291  ORF Transcript_33906/g.79291 Transcript_33906/m.79291 type:complete len:185 (-) Transcript_33906:27-581(-)
MGCSSSSAKVTISSSMHQEDGMIHPQIILSKSSEDHARRIVRDGLRQASMERAQVLHETRQACATRRFFRDTGSAYDEEDLLMAYDSMTCSPAWQKILSGGKAPVGPQPPDRMMTQGYIDELECFFMAVEKHPDLFRQTIENARCRKERSSNVHDHIAAKEESTEPSIVKAAAADASGKRLLSL